MRAIDSEAKILVVDDESEVGNFFQYLLEEEKGCRVKIVYNGKEALNEIHTNNYDLALIDLKLPDMDGNTLLKNIKSEQPHCQTIIMTGYSTVKTAVEAIKLGAFDYIEKPFESLDELERVIEEALGEVPAVSGSNLVELHNSAEKFGIFYAPESPMHGIIKVARKIAPKNITVLLKGETGTGKELIARYIHFYSGRSNKPFFVVNCGAFTETLLESELFGHVKGAFTGAHDDRKGIFEIAHGGTLFLDEISEASFSTQVKLLRILETGEFRPVGSEIPRYADIRIIAATNKELGQLVKESRFREDLFYRLDVISLELPPLRKRAVDIPLLAKHFIQRATRREDEKKDRDEGSRTNQANHANHTNQALVSITPPALELLKKYHWPGNVRELANVMARAAVLQESGTIGITELPEKISGNVALSGYAGEQLNVEALENGRASLTDIVQWWSSLLPPLLRERSNVDLNELQQLLQDAQVEILRRIITDYQKQTGANNNETAAHFGLTPRALRYLLNEKSQNNKIDLT